MKFSSKLIVPAGKKIRLSEYDPDDTLGLEKSAEQQQALEKSRQRLDELQFLLYAEKRHAALVVLQGVDASGKDGTIRHVMSGLNPQSCKATYFAVPSVEEGLHDFLWRVHKAVPARGEIGIFNRSHYEDVLVVRVHELVPKKVWSRRYEQINLFEKLLVDNSTKMIKLFLHISKKEQKKRFKERLDDPSKHWKLSPSDFKERKYWEDYTRAYEDALSRTSTAEAPWYIIPANKKWFRNLAVSHILTETLEELKMKFPETSFDISRIKVK